MSSSPLQHAEFFDLHSPLDLLLFPLVYHDLLVECNHWPVLNMSLWDCSVLHAGLSDRDSHQQHADVLQELSMQAQLQFAFVAAGSVGDLGAFVLAPPRSYRLDAKFSRSFVKFL
eukprot:gnl/MRDRNA2_/MRDRNA2_48216_c0_seq2.p1 gnl/MRDRNA2_/MRDRNA2_48216_c0~~gnl/MRDRNA2_/MRDRNA2_48216_c0_seq2.p1  ORF type:complete len:115 (+),score=6.64 gnl/MRDRNA2_/MRDRNA2_48216_c0_seq2:88-432(+)